MNITTLCEYLSDERLAALLQSIGAPELIARASVVRAALCDNPQAAAVVDAALAKKGNGCRCKNTAALKAAVQQAAAGATMAVVGGQSGYVPPSTVPYMPKDDWNCRTDTGDLAPCDLHKIVTDPYPVFTGTMLSIPDTTGLPAAPAGFEWYENDPASPFPILQVSNVVCIESFALDDNGGPPPAAVTPLRFALQGEKIFYDQGQIVHAWDDPVFTARTGWEITANRCRCIEPPCVCLPAGARMRFVVLAAAGFALLNFELEVYRDPAKLGNVCGPCPPSELCGQLTIARCECAGGGAG